MLSVKGNLQLNPQCVAVGQDIVAIAWQIVQGRFLQRVVWIMESRLGVRAADAKTLPIITTCTNQPSPSPVCTSAGLQHPFEEHSCAAAEEEVGHKHKHKHKLQQRRWGRGRGTDAILIIGQGLRRTGVCVH